MLEIPKLGFFMLIGFTCFYTGQVNAQPTPLSVVSSSHLVAVTGPANRLVLTKAIIDFCGALPIYNTETIEGVAANGNGTSSKLHIVNLVIC